MGGPGHVPELTSDVVANSLLAIALDVAVPLWINELRALSFDHRMERAKICAQVVAEKGDVLQFGGGKRGEAANAFNRLAEGVGCLAFAPGGVKIFGRHWQAPRRDPVRVPLTQLDTTIRRVLRDPVRE